MALGRPADPCSHRRDLGPTHTAPQVPPGLYARSIDNGLGRALDGLRAHVAVMRRSPVFVGLCAMASVSLLGCGDSERTATNSRTADVNTPWSEATDRPPRPPDHARGKSARDTPSSAQEPVRAITKDSGAVYVPPAKPLAQSTKPTRGCDDREATSGDRALRVSFPPAPGVRATRTGSEVRLDYTFRPVPPRCTPIALDVTLDVNDDSLPGRNKSFRVRLPGGSVRVDIPSDMQNVDVARVVARTKRGAPSASTAVAIQ